MLVSFDKKFHCYLSFIFKETDFFFTNDFYNFTENLIMDQIHW